MSERSICSGGVRVMSGLEGAEDDEGAVDDADDGAVAEAEADLDMLALLDC